MPMSADIKDLMDKMGVGYVPGAYESVPWSHYDAESGTVCSAEVRMGGGGDEIEAEIQMMYDTPPAGKPPMEQVCTMRCAPNGGLWTVTSFRIRGATFGADVHNWEEKACLFFRLVAQEIMGGRLPNIDAVLDDAFYSRERYADQGSGGGGQSPKINTNSLLNNLKGGRGF